MEAEFIRSRLTDRFHDAQNIMKKSELALETVSKAVKKTASTPWAKRYKEEIDLLGMMITDYIKKDYGYLNASTIVIGFSALLYILSPLDKISGKLPFLKGIDDAAVIAFALHAIREELKTYKLWLNTKELRK